ncbi:MAG: class I tRNA ligase family protein, partial [Staphylococcus xylosus]|nr:class I tRNA ligase family protein [Staphylococcus xylosus]
KQTSDVYRKIRNTLRFMLGNVNDYNPATDAIAEDNLLEVDKYLLNRLREFTANTLDHYDNYDYLDIFQEVQNFINVELSNFYLDYGKDILYIEERDSHKRRSMQTVLYQIVVDMTKLLAPILVHTSEEVWSHIPHVEEESVHLTNMPDRVEVDREFVDRWNTFMKLRDDVNRALEVARNEKVIGKSLEAKVVIGSNDNFDATSFLQQFADLQQLFITSQAEVVDHVEDGIPYQYGDIRIEHAHGEKCERCWNYSESLGSVGELNNLCPRCQEVVKTLV